MDRRWSSSIAMLESPLKCISFHTLFQTHPYMCIHTYWPTIRLFTINLIMCSVKTYRIRRPFQSLPYYEITRIYLVGIQLQQTRTTFEVAATLGIAAAMMVCFFKFQRDKAVISDIIMLALPLVTKEDVFFEESLPFPRDHHLHARTELDQSVLVSFHRQQSCSACFSFHLLFEFHLEPKGQYHPEG